MVDTEHAPLSAGESGAAPLIPQAPEEKESPQLVEADLLVEDVSIDGMCGVY
jgi:mycofactocin precursor